MRPILVAGTGSWRDDGAVDWYCPGHAFGAFLRAEGVEPLYDGDGDACRPFIWSTDLAGLPFFTNRKDWAAGGAALAYFIKSCRRLPGARTALIVHSHGLQVAAYAAAEHGLKVDTLISVGSPIRKDLTAPYEALRHQTRFWLHIHSDWSDRWQWFGELFDGHFGIVRESALADRNDFVPKVGHSEILREPAQFHHWTERGWLKLLQPEAVAAT